MFRNLWLGVLVTAWALASLFMVSDGAVSVIWDMVVLYVGGALCGMAILLWTIAGSMRKEGAPVMRGRRWPGLVYALLVIAVVPSLCRYSVPLKIRLSASRDALIKAAADAPQSDAPQWIGWFHVLRITKNGPVTNFVTGPCDLASDCGLALSPGAQPRSTEKERYQRFADPWWLFAVKR